MDHSYEEIRRAAIDIISGKEKESYTNNQFSDFRNNITEVLKKREEEAIGKKIEGFSFSEQDDFYFQEVFWDLFRQGIITIGTGRSCDQGFPFFRLTSYGKKLFENEELYFFHDFSSYEKIIRENIQNIDDLTIFYLKEAMSTFMVGCYLSSSVMLGVALEYSLNNLYDVIDKNDIYKEQFSKVFEEKTLLRKFNKFRYKLREIQRDLPPNIKEDLDTNLDMIVSVIRNFRNESGHPNGKVLSREQCYVNLHLFIPCCKKIYDLMEFFRE